MPDAAPVLLGGRRSAYPQANHRDKTVQTILSGDYRRWFRENDKLAGVIRVNALRGLSPSAAYDMLDVPLPVGHHALGAASVRPLVFQVPSAPDR